MASRQQMRKETSATGVPNKSRESFIFFLCESFFCFIEKSFTLPWKKKEKIEKEEKTGSNLRSS